MTTAGYDDLLAFFNNRPGRDSSPPDARIHPRVNRILKVLPRRLEDGHDVSLHALAVVAGLSPSRFMHVFTESLGIPLRRYILVLRVQRAYAELMAGATVTAAACTAGFSDAPHLTRTFRKILGMTPSELPLRKTRSVIQHALQTGVDEDAVKLPGLTASCFKDPTTR
jgi:AraC-like DNA-binding protein